MLKRTITYLLIALALAVGTTTSAYAAAPPAERVGTIFNASCPSSCDWRSDGAKAYTVFISVCRANGDGTVRAYAQVTNNENTYLYFRVRVGFWYGGSVRDYRDAYPVVYGNSTGGAYVNSGYVGYATINCKTASHYWSY
jgi:hypothetical protein